MSLPNTNTNTNTTTPSPRFSTNPQQQSQPRNVTAMGRGSYPHRSHIPRSVSVSSYAPPPPPQQVHHPPPSPSRVVGSLYTTTNNNHNHNHNLYYNTSTSSPSQCQSQGIPYNNNNTPLHGYHNNNNYNNNNNNNNNCYGGNTSLLPPHPPPIYSLRPLPLPPYHHQTVPSPAPAPAPDSNGYKDSRSKEDSFITVRDRKVRVSASSSLYAACRSWLRNGVREETQPHYLDGIKLLPKPSPPPVPDAHSPAEPTKEEEEEESIEHLSPKDLLKRHVKRAKKVRARLRDERLQRIARYKTRLALLLPPLEVQQHQFRNESAAGN